MAWSPCTRGGWRRENEISPGTACKECSPTQLCAAGEDPNNPWPRGYCRCKSSQFDHKCNALNTLQSLQVVLSPKNINTKWEPKTYFGISIYRVFLFPTDSSRFLLTKPVQQGTAVETQSRHLQATKTLTVH